MKPLFGSDAKEVIRNGLEFSASQWRFTQFDMATIQFLKARCVPLYQVHYVSVQETTGQRWHFTFLLTQKEGLWCVKTSGGGPEGVLNEPQGLHDCPWVRLETLSMANEFYAFGEVLDKSYHIARVRLLEPGGLVLEDTVQDGFVLFYSEQPPTVPPIQLELYNNSGILISRQTQTHKPFPSVTKEAD